MFKKSRKMLKELKPEAVNAPLAQLLEQMMQEIEAVTNNPEEFQEIVISIASDAKLNKIVSQLKNELKKFAQ